MKSLVEEASSVVKAIEKAWNRAGCPQTFSVKVFETPETNFFGFTKKSAKVGIFFEEEPAPQQRKYASQGRDQRTHNGQRPPSKGRTDAPAYSREREEKESDTVQVESRRPHHQAPREKQGRNYPNRERSAQPRPPRNDEPVPFVEETQHDMQPRMEQEVREPREQRAPRDRNQRTERTGEQRSERTGSGDRRSSSRGQDRRGGRDNNRGNRPDRAQRHEFDEQRPLFNGSSEQSHAVHENGSHEPATPACHVPEMANASLAPQKKVLKVSGRCYTAPVKKTDE